MSLPILVQISDLHITEAGRRVCDRIDTAAFLVRCVARVRSLATPPAAVVITGDLVDRGVRAEYEHLRALLAPLEMPVYLLLGNHDDRAAFRAVFDDARYAGDFVQHAFDVGSLRVLALDSHDPGRPGGRLCADRLAWLERELAAAAGRTVVIALHHPPFVTGVPFLDACGLAREDAALLGELVARHGNVERVICGHVHRAITARIGGALAMSSPSCAHQAVLGFEPDSLAGYTFEPPGFVQHVVVDGALISHVTPIDVAPEYPF